MTYYIYTSGTNMTATPLHNSVRDGDLTTCNELIITGHDVNAIDENGLLPIHIAASMSNIRMIKLLLQYNACLTCVDTEGNTALHMIVQSDAYSRRKFVGIMRQMVRQGANRYVANKSGMTPHNYMTSEDRDMMNA